MNNSPQKKTNNAFCPTFHQCWLLRDCYLLILTIVFTHGATNRVFFFFVFWIYCFFNCDISYWFLYVASVKVTSFLRSILIIFLKHPTKSALKIARQMINDGKWQYRSLTTFCLPCLRKNCAEKNERIRWYHAHF